LIKTADELIATLPSRKKMGNERMEKIGAKRSDFRNPQSLNNVPQVAL
jgi:hypothetical protein